MSVFELRAPGQAAAERLLAELRNDTDGDDSAATDTATNLRDWETPEQIRALSELDDDTFAPEVLAAVDALLRPGEAVGPGARGRMVAGAERAVRRRHALLAGLLPVALRAGRETADMSQAQVADIVGIQPSAVAAVELGKEQIASLTPQTVAAWIRAVSLPPENAIPALWRSLAPRVAEGVYASSPRARRRR